MNLNDLIKAAFECRRRSYSPYSNYEVGAAVLAEDDSVWTGCNVENISYGLSVCAERVAVTKMISEGPRRIKAIAIATLDGGTPCGMCVQTLLEFVIDPNLVEVVTQSEAGVRQTYRLSELMPHAFSSEKVFRGDIHSGDARPKGKPSK